MATYDYWNGTAWVTKDKIAFVSSVDVQYYLSTSDTSATGGTWSSTAPVWTAGHYMWSRTRVIYDDGSSAYAPDVNGTNISGAPGTPGADGKGISSIVEEYYLSTSSTTQTGGSWATFTPAWVSGTYIWTRTTITYTDATTLTTNPVNATGATGAPGAPGVNAVTGVLSNDAATVPADSSGTVSSFMTALTAMYVFNGATDDSSNWTFSQTSLNCTVSASGTPANRTASLTAMSADSASVTFTASRSGYSNVVKKFTVTKTIAGTIGSTGASATSYWLVSDAVAIAKSITNVYTPATINLSGKTQNGVTTPAAYSGRFIVAEDSGSGYVDQYTSSANESTKSWTPSAGIKAVRLRMYLAGGTTVLLDEVVVPIVKDGPVQTDASALTTGTIADALLPIASQGATVTAAQTTANGKNKVVYSASTPGTTINSAGDIWYQEASGIIVGQWTGNGGTSWTAVTLGNAVLASLDAGKITTGTLDAARIAAGSITATLLSATAIDGKTITGVTITGGTVIAGALTLGNADVHASGSSTAIGTGALGALTTGVYNTAFGSQAQAALTTGYDNTAVGAYTQQSLTTGGFDTAVGTMAQKNLTTAATCTAVGAMAQVGLQTGAGATAVGYGAQQNAVNIGQDSTAIGAYAQNALTTGDSDTAVGSRTQRFLTTGRGDTAVGAGVQENMTTGNFNSAVGFFSQQTLTTGSANTAVGDEAQWALTTGNANSAVGSGAQLSLTTGIANTAIGTSAQTSANMVAGNATTTGSYQTSVGPYTGQSSPTAVDGITTVGYRAIAGAANATSIGREARADHAGSIALGYQTTTTQTNQIMVGGRDVEITDSSKGVVLVSPDSTRYRISVANGGGISTGHSPGPYAMAAGTGTLTNTGGGNYAGFFWDDAVTITFPSGRFSVAPIVTATSRAMVGLSWPIVSNVTATGFTVQSVCLSYRTNGTFSWSAVQMTSTSASG